jgi:hypothetical protein
MRVLILLSLLLVLLLAASPVDSGRAEDYDYRAAVPGFPAVFGPYEIWPEGRVVRR